MKKPALYSTLEEMKSETLPEKIPDGNKTNLSFFLKRTNFDHGPGAMKVIFYKYRMYDYFVHELFINVF